jgi:hypothetical protein
VINNNMEKLNELDTKDYMQYPVGSYERTKPWLDKLDAAIAKFDEAYRRHMEQQNNAVK